MIIVLTTSIAAPDGIPQALNVASSTSTSITISWDRVVCLQRNSGITGYLVSYGRMSPTGLPMAEESVGIEGVGAGSRVFTVVGLFPRTSYSLSVMAVNTEGQVGPSATIQHTTISPEGIQLEKAQ